MSYSLSSKNSSSYSDPTKDSASYSNTGRSTYIGIWDITIFPWQEALPWQLGGTYMPAYNQPTKD